MQEDKKQPNTPQDDLKDFRSLIGDASSEGFDLDAILAEYGAPSTRDHGAVPVGRPEHAPTVVAFPGVTLPTPQPDPLAPRAEVRSEPEEKEEEKELEGPELFPVREKPPAPVIPFPVPPEEEEEEEDPSLAHLIKDIGRRADSFADQMFEEDERTDPEEIRRLERLIPGTDDEEDPLPPKKKVRPPKKKAPPPPDTDPKELAQSYLKGLKGLHLRTCLLLLIFLLTVVQLAVPEFGYAFPAPLNDPLWQSWFAAGAMGLSMLLAADTLWAGLISPFKGRVGPETLSLLACLLTLTDGILLALRGSDRLPFTAAACAGLYFIQLGRYHRRCALRLSCRTAAATSSPYRVTLDEGKWNGRDTYTKWAGDPTGFGSQVQMEDGAARLYSRFYPILLLIACGLSLFWGLTRPQQLLWGASALMVGMTALGSSLAYGRSYHNTARRLAQSGAALAGWPGMVGSRRDDRVLITDTDLFPPGYVDLNGFKVLGDFPMERVVAYTATMIRDSGSGLTKPFHDYLRRLGGLMRNSERLCCYEGGGLSATIRGDQVLVGSAAFMNLMEIPLPPGLNVKSAVFCAINGELAGIFALSYTLPDSVFPALDALIREKVGPVLATRDFNLIPAMLQQRFKLAANRMDFPPVERRRELSAPDQTHGEALTALLCREGLYPFAEAVSASKRMRHATRMGALLSCLSSTLGLLLTSYLVHMSAYGSLSPMNLLFFLIMWMFPVWLLTSWCHRF